jgi:hypothetical protein
MSKEIDSPVPIQKAYIDLQECNQVEQVEFVKDAFVQNEFTQDEFT